MSKILKEIFDVRYVISMNRLLNEELSCRWRHDANVTSL